MIGLFVLVGALLATALVALAMKRKNGSFKQRDDAEYLSAEDIGATLGERATLVQFSSTFCAPCRATRVLLADVAGKIDGVVAVDIDATNELDLVRRFNIMRTPTVFVLDESGAIVQRASGMPRKVDVIAALGKAIPA